MLSDCCPEGRQNPGDNVFEGIPVGPDEADLFDRFLFSHDFSPHTRRALRQDVRKFARWFAAANRERFVISRVTTRDITDFREYLRRDRGQAVASVNRVLVTLRRFFAWVVEQGHLAMNPAKQVKELRRQQLAPKGLDRSQVRRLLREVELRKDIRAGAIFSLMLYTGCRVGDLVSLELDDHYVILPEVQSRDEDFIRRFLTERLGSRLPEGFAYTSDTNTQWLTEKELSELVKLYPLEKN